MVVLHFALTHGRALVGIWPRRTDPRRSPLVALHLGAGLALLVAGVAAVVLRAPLAPLIPPLDTLAGELWGAATAGALVAYLVTVIRSAPVEDGAFVAEARRRLDTGLIALARREAAAHGADPDLVEAILITESTQRPRWFRRLERIKSWLAADGTYGVMQVHSAGWVSDEESIRVAVSEHLAGQRVPIDSRGHIDSGTLRTQLANYNRSPDWFEMVLACLYVLRQS